MGKYFAYYLMFYFFTFIIILPVDLKVHQLCLQRWVDEKQKGNYSGKVSCPQCNTEYIIVYPKMGKVHNLNMYTF